MTRTRSILIAEDHRILREGLRALLTDSGRYGVIGEVDNGRDAVASALELNPDAVLMDLSMPGINGTEAIHEIRKHRPHIRIVVLTAHRADEYVQTALRAGADGYLLKDDSHDDLVKALESVLRGRTWLSPGICSGVVSRSLGGGRAAGSSPLTRLTHREREVLKLVAEGHRNKQIAELLSLSPKTIEKHRTNLMRKLSVSSATGLTAWAFEHGVAGR